MSLQRTPGEFLAVNRGGRIVVAVSALLIVYGVVALGEIVLPVFAALQLLGGYLLLVILFRVVSAIERAVGAYEQRVEHLTEESAGETAASAPGSETDDPDGSTDA